MERRKKRKVPQHMHQMYMLAGGHKWIKRNKTLVTVPNDEGYDVYRCVYCGVSGRVWQDEPVIYIGAQYNSALVSNCSGPIEQEEKEEEVPLLIRRKKKNPELLLRRKKKSKYGNV